MKWYSAIRRTWYRARATGRALWIKFRLRQTGVTSRIGEVGAVLATPAWKHLVKTEATRRKGTPEDPSSPQDVADMCMGLLDKHYDLDLEGVALQVQWTPPRRWKKRAKGELVITAVPAFATARAF